MLGGDLRVVEVRLSFVAEVGDRVEEGESHVGAGHCAFHLWEEVAVGVRETRFWVRFAFSPCCQVPGLAFHLSAGAEVWLENIDLAAGSPRCLHVEHRELGIPWVAILLKDAPSKFGPFVNNNLIRSAKLLAGVGRMVQDKPGGEVGEVPRLSALPILQKRIRYFSWIVFT